MSPETKKLSARERILNTADKLFYAQGFHTTGINQIIDEAEIAKATLYQHFKSKDELCIAYLEDRHKQWQTVIEEYLSPNYSAQENIIRIFDYLKDTLVNTKFQGCAFLNILAESHHHSPDVVATIQWHKNEFLNLFKTLVSKLPRASKKLAEKLFLIYEGAMISGKLYGSAVPAEVARATAKELI